MPEDGREEHAEPAEPNPGFESDIVAADSTSGEPGGDSDWARLSGQSGWKNGDLREPAERDHDRIFYSAEFARLEGVTQIATIVSTSVHNRLTHSYRVEQVARTIAQKFSDHGARVDVVSSAALGHDIGHPPFGHTGEMALQRAVMCSYHYEQAIGGFTDRQPRQTAQLEGQGAKFSLACRSVPPCKLIDGFEGNAQSFRILTRLAAQKSRLFNDSTVVLPPDDEANDGLDLTRRVLMAGLKYPWTKGAPGRKPKKWGVYDNDVDVFRWVLQTPNGSGEPPATSASLEAQIMDTADDIAYAVHDLEDFHKAGVIPLADLRVGGEAFRRVVQYVKQDPDKAAGVLKPLITAFDNFVAWRNDSTRDGGREEPGDDSDDQWTFDGRELLSAVNRFLGELAAAPYHDSFEDRATLTRIRSQLIGLFIDGLAVRSVGGKGELYFVDDLVRIYVEFLKQLTWYYVIEDPSLIAIREGQERMIASCFEFLYNTAARTYIAVDGGSSSWKLVSEPRGVPERLRNYVELGRARQGRYFPSEVVARATVDYICSMTDVEFYRFSSQLSGLQAEAVPANFRG